MHTNLTVNSVKNSSFGNPCRSTTIATWYKTNLLLAKLAKGGLYEPCMGIKFSSLHFVPDPTSSGERHCNSFININGPNTDEEHFLSLQAQWKVTEKASKQSVGFNPNLYTKCHECMLAFTCPVWGVWYMVTSIFQLHIYSTIRKSQSWKNVSE